MKTNATQNELNQALETINNKFNNNVIWNNFEFVNGKTISFTLKVRDSKEAGHRLGFPNSEGKQRRMANACWHVHGELFDALFALNSDIYVRAGSDKITINRGNWQDRNIGSQMSPLYFSEACDCN